MIIETLIEFEFERRMFCIPPGRRMTEKLLLLSNEGTILRQNIDVGPNLMIHNSTLRALYVGTRNKMVGVPTEWVTDYCLWVDTQAEYLAKELLL